MSTASEPPEPIGQRAYASFAERYAASAPTKPHNALYERPASLALLGDVDGLDVLDAGCGPGLCSAILAASGARVHAFDVTPAMADLARERCRGLSVDVRIGDLARPLDWLAAERFDRVLCTLVLDSIETLGPVFREFHRVTRPGGALVFSMAHPMRDWMDERTHGGADYFATTRFGLYWTGFGEPNPYVEGYRRPLTAILEPLAASGWSLERFVEPLPLPAMKQQAPKLHAELSRAPAFLCVRARRLQLPDERSPA